MVLSKRVLWSVISVMWIGSGLDGSSVGKDSGMCVAGRLYGLMVPVDVFIKLAYDFGSCEGKLLGVCQELSGGVYGGEQGSVVF